ncbi:ABC transporter ATP-binding protein [Paraliobacillus sp. JSM ZJ581]|uniref:ABC transporter ATP-binding protein n=1 Tax=Paraliobacillus sp. JSM ZJ581 TaxID=3342118 RepID=UPI0035A86C09
MSVILNASNISKTFSNDLIAVKRSSLEVKKGKIHVIEGKSGSGKSTLLSMIGGIEEPTLGKVYYRNRSFYELNDDEQANIRGKFFGFIFQSFFLIPELTVRENIELPLVFNQIDNNKLNVKKIAESLEIGYLLDKKPSQLSGGEQQRVAIARSLITLPEVIFADEPTGNLDHKTTRKIADLVSEFNRMYGITFIIVTHEKNLIRVPHHLYKMQKGELKMEYINV